MASEIKMGISLDSSGVRKGLAKAKSSVKNFTTEATESFKTFTKVGVGALVAGFSVAARKSLSYAKEVENLSRISNTSIEEFQRNAHAAQTVGIEQEKLADIYKDVGDKMGEFLENDGGAMLDYFENIAPLVGQTKEQFEGLSGPDALQLYFNGLEQANLSQARMSFYLEAIGNDATALIPLLAKNGQAFRDLGKDATVMGDSTVAELAKAEKALDSLERKTIIVAGRIVEAFSFLFGKSEVQESIKEQEKAINDKLSGAVTLLELENKVEFSQKDKASLLDPSSDVGKISKIMSDYGIEPENEFAVASEAFNEAIIKSTKMQRAARGESIAEQQERNKKAAKDQADLTMSIRIKKAKKDLADAEARAANDAITNEEKLSGLIGNRDKLQKKMASLDEIYGSTRESAEQIETQKEILDLDREINKAQKEVTAEKKRQAKQDADTAAKKQKQFDDEVNKANEASDAAAKKVADDAKIAKEKAELKKDQSLRKELLEAQINQRDGLAHAIQEEIILKQRAKQIQQEIGGEYERALELAKEILKVEAGPDANRSGFVTRKEQRAFDKAQKVRAKEQKKRQREEIRNEIKKKQNMTARERAKAAADDRKRRRNEAQDKRNDAKKKDQLEKEKEAGDEVKKNQDAMKKAAKDVLKKREDMKPKKPENAIIDKFIPKLNRQIELLEAINKSLECEG